MKGIYLAAHTAKHENRNIIYQDITGERDIAGDMLEIELKEYDYIIATPPCNYWSRARGNKEPSKYAKETKHLLPEILKKLRNQNKPYIVENVRSYPKFKKEGILDMADYVYFVGRHTYWTNIPFNPTGIKQIYDFKGRGLRLHENTQGGINVKKVIDFWIDNIYNENKKGR